jgi:hypothetical protein
MGVLLMQWPPESGFSAAWQLVIAFVLGAVGTWLVEWHRQHRNDNRVRRAIREALAVELRMNLQLLDAHEKLLNENLSGTSEKWPTELPFTAAIDHANAPGISVLLTDTEQVTLALLTTQLRSLAGRLKNTWEEIGNPNLAPFSRTPNEVAAEFLESGELEVTGTFLVRALTTVLTEQGDFVLSASIEGAQRLQPTLNRDAIIGSTVWRTSDLDRWPAGDDIAVAWKDDDPERKAHGAATIVLSTVPLETFDIIDRGNLAREIGATKQAIGRERAMARNKQAVKRMEKFRAQRSKGQTASDHRE